MHRLSEYEIRGASSDDDLLAILDLQAANLTDGLDAEERRSQGFVTLRHDIELLREMNQPWPHIIATPEGREDVAAYALVMMPSLRGRLPKLDGMFERLESVGYEGRALSEYRWYVMGQICVAKAHRGRGLVELLYAEHRRRMSPHFQLMITEIDRANGRSMRAHEKAGFKVIHEYRTDAGNEWLIVLLDLRAAS